MVHLLPLLAVALAMALLREPLGRALTALVDQHGKALVIIAVLLLLAWIAAHNAQLGLATPIGDVAALFDSFAYADLFIGAAVAVFNRQTRQLAGSLVDLVRAAGRVIVRSAGRGRRTRVSGKPRRAPLPEEPDPAWAFA